VFAIVFPRLEQLHKNIAGCLIAALKWANKNQKKKRKSDEKGLSKGLCFMVR